MGYGVIRLGQPFFKCWLCGHEQVLVEGRYFVGNREVCADADACLHRMRDITKKPVAPPPERPGTAGKE